MSYQSFAPGEGHSNSFGKAIAMAFPDRMDGCSFLDLGCNEGFFCNEAAKRGASRTVGIDMSDAAIDAARARFPEITFFRSDWWSFKDTEQYDYILLSSALHYESNPRELCRKISTLLKP